MSDKNIDSIVERLDKIIEVLKNFAPRRENSKVQDNNNFQSEDMETIEGQIRNLSFKQGAKCEFAIFTLESHSKGAIQCKCFNSDLLSLLDNNLRVEASGIFQEWKGFVSFVVKKIQIVGTKSKESSDVPAPEEDEDDMPF